MRLFAILLLLIGSAPLSGQDMFLQPPDLEPGDQYRLVFLTSTVRDATSTDIADYDAIVQATADAAPEVSTWKLNWRAIGSTREIDARDHTESHPIRDESVPTYRLDGTLFAANYGDLWSGVANIDPNGIRVTEFGELHLVDPVEGIEVWTGTDIGGTVAEFGPGGNSLGSRFVGTGQAELSAHQWYLFGLAPRDELHHMYGISDVLVAVHEPSGEMSALIAFVVAMTFRRAPRGCRVAREIYYRPHSESR